MFRKLQQKWGINGWRFFRVMCTFAFTGITAAWLTAKITGWLEIEKWTIEYWALKLFILFVGYQILLLSFGAIFGEFQFFWKYEKKVLRALGILKKEPPSRILVFASGAGSNAKNLIHYFNHNPKKSKRAIVVGIVTNNPHAGVIELAERENIPVTLIQRIPFENGTYLNNWEKEADWFILAGFLWKCPEIMVKKFPKRIINLHPALLPQYGGKGMFGQHVHTAVLKNNEKTSGITIHFIDERYDCGENIFQAAVNIEENETPESLAVKIHALEHKHLPQVTEQVIKKAKAKLNP